MSAVAAFPTRPESIADVLTELDEEALVHLYGALTVRVQELQIQRAMIERALASKKESA